MTETNILLHHMKTKKTTKKPSTPQYLNSKLHLTMSNPRNPNPSLLGHTSVHKSTPPMVTTSPLEYPDQTLVSEKNAQSSNIQTSGFEDRLSYLEKGLNEEKLNISKKDALLLSAVARDARRKHLDINWDNFLPSLFRTEDLRTIMPTLVTSYGYGSSLTGHAGLDRRGVESPLQRESSPCAPNDFLGHVEAMVGDLKNEKLSCSKESLILIQNSRKCDVYPNEAALFFDAVLQPYQKTHEPGITLSPMSSSQFYSPSPSPKPQISPDPVSQDETRDKLSGSGQAILQPCIQSCKQYPESQTAFGPDGQHPPVITLEEDVEPSVELARFCGPASDFVCMSIEPNHEARDIKNTDRVSRQNEIACLSVEKLDKEINSSISHPYLRDHDAPRHSTPLEVPVDDHSVDDTSNHKGKIRLANKGNHKLRKREDKLGNTDTCRHRRRPKRGKKMNLSQNAQDISIPSSPFTALGSLTAFMETRGKFYGRRVNAKSPYFAAEGTGVEHSEPAADARDTRLGLDEKKLEANIIPNTITQYNPGYPKENQEPMLLFMSISLLKSHLSLVRILESQNEPMRTLIYRDYGSRILQTASSTNITHGLQNEADIIISPSTGIILTTSQATTQLYLPGHKPSHPRLEYIKDLNSPLRERIMLAAPRYEQLYIFLCHSSGTPETKSQGKTGLTADKRTLESTTSLMAFCSSLSRHSTVTPLFISPASPEIIVEWVLSLAHKHSYRLPAGQSQNTATIGFTPINQEDNKTRLDPALMETETQWELFLRRSGLNPFAAQAVLAVLEMRNASDGSKRPFSEFFEMSTKQRRSLFSGILGDKILDRVEAVIEKDWQCDWALDFEAIGM